MSVNSENRGFRSMIEIIFIELVENLLKRNANSSIFHFFDIVFDIYPVKTCQFDDFPETSRVGINLRKWRTTKRKSARR